MAKDRDRLIAEKAITTIENFMKQKDFLGLFEEIAGDDFIKYVTIEATEHIGIMRRLDHEILEKRMQELLANLDEKSYARYRAYACLFYLTDDEKYIDYILEGLQSTDDDRRYQAIFTIDDILFEDDLDRETLLIKIEEHLHLNMEQEERYNRIYREIIINSIREKLGKEKEIICKSERMFFEKVQENTEDVLRRCVFELYYPIHENRYEIVLNLLEKNRDKTDKEEFFIFGSYIESIYGNDEVNVYQQWLEANGSKKNKAIILYLRAVWEVVNGEYHLKNERALKYAKEALEYTKDIAAIYHLIGRLTSPGTAEYKKLKKAFEENMSVPSLEEIKNIPLEELYSYDTFLSMDILKKVKKPENFFLILLDDVDDNFWNWGL